ncbi:MAG: hypothetical protein IJ766_08490 [Clostridia bacterium]|nr:hypothetical protein [Clostridia bacterium]
MQQILKIHISDVVKFSKGILFVREEKLDGGEIKVSFYAYDVAENQIAPITKSVYLLNKFGRSFKPIEKQLGDYVSCDAGRLPDGGAAVIYTTGEMGIFTGSGELKWTGDLLYHGCPARDIAVENKHIWSVVPDMKAVIRYSVTANKVVMRIGGGSTGTFQKPVSVSEYENVLYICDREKFCIKTIDLSDFSVRDYRQFEEPVHKYLQSAGKEFAVLNSGVYIL